MEEFHNLRRQNRVLQFCFFDCMCLSGWINLLKTATNCSIYLKFKKEIFSCYKNMLYTCKSKTRRLHIPFTYWGKKYLSSCKLVMGYIVLLDDSHSSWLIPEFTAIFQVLSGRYLLSIFYFHTWNILFNFALLFLLSFPKIDILLITLLLHSTLQI